MSRYVSISVATGVLFAVLDALINANPLAQRLFAAYAPIARPINPAAGMAIDAVYGFALTGVFLLLHGGLPGRSGLMKGLSFAIFAWFFRVVMSVASQWMMFNVPDATLLYSLLTGLGEMLILGAFIGLTMKPPRSAAS